MSDPKEEKDGGVIDGEAEPESKAQSLAKIIGPGVITGASDDDPSGIATYSQAGARFGAGFL